MRKFKVDITIQFSQTIEVVAEKEEDIEFDECDFRFENMDREGMDYIESFVSHIEEIKE